MSEDKGNRNNQPEGLEQGTYEIIRNRLNKQGDALREGLSLLNTSRKEVFGAIETTLLTSERITTENKCIPSDMIAIGDHFIFSYNVHIGLRTTTKLGDVFSVYQYKEHAFHQEENTLINDQKFQEDFSDLYKYYKHTQFSRFVEIGPYLYMVFKLGKGDDSIKVFKWKVNKNTLTYIDNRSDHEVVFPDQYEFTWKRTVREMYRDGLHPHISIEDQVFVEAVGGDLTIKVEDNTNDGKGIYNEAVDYPDQTLDDAEIFYAVVGNMIFLKIKPYKEDKFRYIIYNSKIREAIRIDAIENSCVLLPDDHGVIFPKGYYLQTGESKVFDMDLGTMRFQKSIASPNVEDFLYVFYNNALGTYALLSYNLISQEIATPTICHGFSFFDNGELCYFKSEEEPQNHHAVQIWQTPYESESNAITKTSDSFLMKIGNKDIVRAMAECHEVLNLIAKEDSYANLYVDIVKKSADIIDSYYWIDKSEAHDIEEPLNQIKSSASSAIDEFDKVVKIKKNTTEEQNKITTLFEEVTAEIRRTQFNHIDSFVQLLAKLRTVRGQVISLKELRYVDLGLIEKYELELTAQNNQLSNKCVAFLLKKDALKYYVDQIEGFNTTVEKLAKVVDINELNDKVLKASEELEMLIEIVSNLKIEDATQTTKIVNNISEIYARFNQINAVIKRKRKELQLVEGEAVFNSQIKLIGQGMTNYLDISDSAEKCEEYLTKLMIQLEELEGKFSEFEEYIAKVSEKRDEVYNAFESRKVSLIEKKNKRTTALQTSADRILKGIASRLEDMSDLNEINGYIASDLMVDKLRNIIEELIALGDTVKSDDLQSKLKTVKEEAVRQLKDKTELFEGDHLISFGQHKFSVNNQVLDLTIVPKGDEMYFHITGTNFFEEITNPEFLATKNVWKQQLISENQHIYRSEYLAFQLYLEIVNTKEYGLANAYNWTEKELYDFTTKTMAPKYNEGYTKGVHDNDAVIILKELIKMAHLGGVLKYAPETRACSAYYWNFYLDDNARNSLDNQLKSSGAILKAFPETKVFESLIDTIAKQLQDFNDEQQLFNTVDLKEAARYLFDELATNNKFSISKNAFDLCEAFNTFLKTKKQEKAYKDSVNSLETAAEKYTITKSWLHAYVLENDAQFNNVIGEAVIVLNTVGLNKKHLINTDLKVELSGFNGTHPRIKKQKITIDFHEFINRLSIFSKEDVPAFTRFNDLKKQFISDYKEDLKLDGLRPKVMNSFVRNQLINEVYLPLIGDNLAKQIGSAGENKRTDLMGMLLLISPPGYGKTTLMEYIASRLGIIFLKINGPSIGHDVTSLDPDDAPNAGAREEIEKLNLGFEMGDNVMIYLDDIQHCNPEFLQKFISLCDGQRKIEGVYKGKTKTYDLRGKKVCVTMAGNPYTESGDKFQIPDMLANRADIYNLGDIIGDSDHAFEMSYIENCLTSNTTLRKLSGKSQKDLYTLMKLAQTGNKEGLEFESSHTPQELNDYVAVLQKLIVVRDIILKVNQQYILSAAMEDQYRVEPPFRLQGSYRNMNKIAEKVIPIMNEDELKTLLMSGYENESQTLTTSAESNLLKFKEMVAWMEPGELERWESVKNTFVKNQKLKGFGDQNQTTMILSQMEALSDGLLGISDVLSKNN